MREQLDANVPTCGVEDGAARQHIRAATCATERTARSHTSPALTKALSSDLTVLLQHVFGSGLLVEHVTAHRHVLRLLHVHYVARATKQ